MSDDTRDLAAFGYKQVLDRTLGSFSSFAAGFSYISVLTGVFQTFYLGYGAGGPAFYWTWPAVFLGQGAVALCFAELAARYPLSGGVYQWSARLSSRPIGWLAGWVYLCGSIISLAAVALALQATLPQIAPVFQLVGQPADRSSAGANAVLLGCVLIAVSTVINSIGVRHLARINNIGVIAELCGVGLLIVLLAACVRRGPEILFDSMGKGQGQSFGYLGPFLAAALMASYVMYGFDTAGSLAEETDEPRRRAPWAILRALLASALAGALLLLTGILAVSDPTLPELGSISGGLPFLVRNVLGEKLGVLLLVEVVFAVFVCALAVHAAAVRLMFAMARDRNLPFARSLSHVSPRTRAPAAPAVVIGLLSAAILIVNANLPNVIEMLCSVAVVWANLAYLLVTIPLLVSRLSRRSPATGLAAGASRAYFSLGRFGLPVNALAAVWGLFVVTNMSWPRPEIYGDHTWGQFAAPLATLALVTGGLAYYALYQRKRTGIVPEHAAGEILDQIPLAAKNLTIENRWIGRHTSGQQEAAHP